MDAGGYELRFALSYKSSFLLFKENSGTLAALLVLCLILSILVPSKFLTYLNFRTILRSISTTAIVVFGMTFVIITGGIDLSVGSVIALSGTLCAGLISSGFGYVIAVIAGLAIGTLCGVIDGFIVSRTPIPPFIVTMSMMNIARGASYIYSSGKPIRTPDAFGNFGNGFVMGVPVPVIVMLIILSASFQEPFRALCIRHRRKSGGRKVFGNQDTADHLAGIYSDLLPGFHRRHYHRIPSVFRTAHRGPGL